MHELDTTVCCCINSSLSPALQLEERVSLREKMRQLRNTIAPILLDMLVLDAIFLGIATPVEAGRVGTLGMLAVSALHGRLTWINVEDAALTTRRPHDGDVDLLRRDDVRGFFIVTGGQTIVAGLILGTGLPASALPFIGLRALCNALCSLPQIALWLLHKWGVHRGT